MHRGRRCTHRGPGCDAPAFFTKMKTWMWLLLAGGALLYLVKTGKLSLPGGGGGAQGRTRAAVQTGGGAAVASQGVVPGLVNTVDAAVVTARQATRENVAKATTDIFGAASGVYTAVKSSGFLSSIFGSGGSKVNPATSGSGAGAAVSTSHNAGAIGDSIDSSNPDSSGYTDSPDITGISDTGIADTSNINEISGYDTGSQTEGSMDTAPADNPDVMLY